MRAAGASVCPSSSMSRRVEGGDRAPRAIGGKQRQLCSPQLAGVGLRRFDEQREAGDHRDADRDRDRDREQRQREQVIALETATLFRR